jgi:hypothetical protein
VTSAKPEGYPGLIISPKNSHDIMFFKKFEQFRINHSFYFFVDVKIYIKGLELIQIGRMTSYVKLCQNCFPGRRLSVAAGSLRSGSEFCSKLIYAQARTPYFYVVLYERVVDGPMQLWYMILKCHRNRPVSICRGLYESRSQS